MKKELHDQIVGFCQPRISEGWLTPERGLEMAEIILMCKPEVVVEIGVFGARSMLAQALALKENGKGKIYGIDPWKVSDAIEAEADQDNRDWWTKNVDLHEIHRKAVESLWAFDLDKFAVVVRAASQNCHELFGKIDILNIDGNHSAVASRRDVELYLPKVKKNGYIWMDDCDWSTKDGTKTLVGALELIDRECSIVRDYGHYRLYAKVPHGQ